MKQRLQQLASKKLLSRPNSTNWWLKDGSASLRFTDILKENNLPQQELVKESKGGNLLDAHLSKSSCANFVEVRVHALTGEVRVNKVVSAVDAGKIMNHKTAESQVYGSIVWGIGIALMEEGKIDHRYGRPVNNDLEIYHVPVNANVPDVDVILIDKADPIVDPMGAKGIGEIPFIGLTAAIANAVYHATDKHIRELPVTPAKLV